MSDGYAISDAAGTISITPSTLATIVQRAAETVTGVHVRRRRRRVDARVSGGRVHVDIGLTATYGAVLPELGRLVQERVAAALSQMCGLEVAAVDVTVEELLAR